MNYWLHRISHCADASWPLLDRGILTIGFSALGYAEFLEKAMAPGGSIDDLNEDVRAAYGSLRRNRHNLWRFLNGMSIRDLVLVPGPGEFSVYEIKGGPHCIADLQLADEDAKTLRGHQITVENGDLMANGERIDLGFYWRVSEVAKGVSRRKYADSALTARMKIRQTNADISTLRGNLDAALRAFGKKKPLTLYGEAIEPTRGKLLEAIHKSLNSDKFEQLIGWYFKRIGATTVSIPQKNQRDKEGDADVIASFDALKFTVYVQAKHHKGTTTGQPAIEQITSYAEWAAERDCNEDTTANWVISSASIFDEAGEKLAREEGVMLINGEEFAQMLLDAGLAGLEGLEL